MEKPMRSLTLDAGFWLSSLATTVAGSPAATRFNRTNGVRPINSVTFAAMRAMMISFFLGPRARTGQNFGDWCGFLDKKIKRASGALQHRDWHQDGVSDIDAYKYPRPNAPAIASAEAVVQ
jgi:hypothetical protein